MRIYNAATGVVAVLEPLGLSTDVERVYRLMLANPSRTPADLATNLGLSESAVRSCLASLADLALLRPVEGSTASWCAVSPRLGLMAMLARAEIEIAQRMTQIDATRASIATLVAEYDAAHEREAIIRLDGLEAVRSRIEEFAQIVTRECLSFNPGVTRQPDAMMAGRPLNQVVLDRGVAIKAVYQESFRNDPVALAHGRWMTDLGGEIRTAPTIPMQMIIVDHECALLPMICDNPRPGALEIRNDALLAALGALFDHVWSLATPFGSTPTADESGLSPQEREVLRLLAEGRTDESVGRKLDVSVRTVRRIVAELVERLGAESRFQAGVLAERNGWFT